MYDCVLYDMDSIYVCMHLFCVSFHHLNSFCNIYNDSNIIQHMHTCAEFRLNFQILKMAALVSEDFEDVYKDGESDEESDVSSADEDGFDSDEEAGLDSDQGK